MEHGDCSDCSGLLLFQIHLGEITGYLFFIGLYLRAK